MTHPPASRNYSEQQAGSLQAGDHLLLPDGDRSAEIQRVDVETDDFGTPAMVLATLTGGGMLRIAAGSTVRILDAAVSDAGRRGSARRRHPASGASARLPTGGTAAEAPEARRPTTDTLDARTHGDEQPGAAPGSRGAAAPAAPAVVVPPLPATPPAVSGPSDEDLALIPAPDGTPESVVEAAAEAHPDAVGVLLLSEQLAKGINTKSGSCLKDLSDLAHELFIIAQGRRERPGGRGPAQRPAVRRQPGPLGLGGGIPGAVQLHLPPDRAGRPRRGLRKAAARAGGPWKRTRSRPGSTPRCASVR